MTSENFNPTLKGEQWALRLSLVGSLGAFTLALSFAMVTRSGAIMLDGFYSLVTVSMSFVTLKVASLMQLGRSQKFQFGYYGFEPLINTIKGIIVLSVTLFALVSAIESIIHGGRPLEVGSAIIFALLSTTICFSMALVLRQNAKKYHSPLLAVDARDWFVDAWISSGIALAFGGAFFISHSQWNNWVPYIDPILVTLIAIAVTPIPIKTVVEGVNQLLAGAPEPELEKKIREALQSQIEDYPIQQIQLQMAQIGRALCISIQVLVPNQFTINHVQDLDLIRSQFTQSIEALHPCPDIEISFTGDEQWFKEELPTHSAELA
jgi:cation diffusion facilitator family transporter